MLGHIIQNFRDAIVLLVLFGFTIFVHELGHFLVALKCGMRVDTFSLGFGPALWKRKIRGITYKIAWIPFGGYVALPQMDPSAMETIQGNNSKEGDGKDAAPGKPEAPLPEISPWKRILVSVAGPAGNVVFGLVLACVIWLSPDAVTYEGSTIVGTVDEASAAYTLGVREGDRITAVGGKTVRTWYDLQMECLLAGDAESVEVTLSAPDETVRTVDIPLELEEGRKVPHLVGIKRESTPCMFNSIDKGSAAEDAGLKVGDIVKTFDGVAVRDVNHFIDLVGSRGGVEVPIVVLRDEQTVSTVVTPRYNEEYERALIGVGPAALITPWMQYKRPLDQLGADAGGILRLLHALVTPGQAGNAAGGLGGPVAIFATLWLSIKISLFNAVGFLRFLNVNLAILNLLPIPVLDGGHIVFALYESVTRRKVHAKVVNVLVNVFAVLLILALLFLSARDIGLVFGNVKKALENDPPAAEQSEVATAPQTSTNVPVAQQTE